MNRVLITGITGLIGRSVAEKLIKYDNFTSLTALVRPGTNLQRFKQFDNKLNIEFIDLGDIVKLKSFLEINDFDIILHIGALRGGRKASRQVYNQVNIQSTEQFIEYALKKKARLIFCSSVGVFGAIPSELPANNECPYKEDNYYHYTKIMCEKVINQAILKGLNAVILRPSITYGLGDSGFPNQLIKLVKFRVFPLSNKNLWLHLCNIDTISEAFVILATSKQHIIGKAYNIADVEPVRQKDLVNFIHRQIYNKNYPGVLKIDNNLLVLGEKISRLVRNELWTSRFELIAHSWFYKVDDAYEQLELPIHYTIPDFRAIIRDRKSQAGQHGNSYN